MNPIYLDHNSTTPVYSDVFDAMLPYFKEVYGNASSIHQFGQKARKAVEQARELVARYINAEDASEIIFTSGGTESNNTALKGAMIAYRQKGNRFVSSAIEHSSVRQVLQAMEKDFAIENVVVPVQPNGLVRVEDIDDAITPNTALVTIMMANNEIGTLQPIKQISALCKKKGVSFHTDAVQAAGKMKLDVRDLGVDLLSLSGHKMGAPKGVGILYVRKGTRLSALIQGGSQERNRRGGTENVPGIVGMGKAAELAHHHGESVQVMKRLRDLFETSILERIPSTSVNGDRESRICNTSNICFEYTDSSALLMALDLKGVSCSTGSACSAGNPEASHVLLALGLPQEKAHASLRFSLGKSTTEEEIARAVDTIVQTVARLRENHPLWKQAANG